MLKKYIFLLLPILGISLGLQGQSMGFFVDASEPGFMFTNWAWEDGAIVPSNFGGEMVISKDNGTWDLTSFETTKIGADGIYVAVSDLGETYEFEPNTGEEHQTHTLNWTGISTLTISRNGIGIFGDNSFKLDNIVHYGISITQNKAVACKGETNGQARIFMSGGTPPYKVNRFTYVANPFTITNLSIGVKNFTVTDGNNKTISGSVTITEPTDELSVSGQLTPVDCKGKSTGSITLEPSGGTPGNYSYNWEKEGNSGVSIGTTNKLTGLAIGTYLVTLTDANNCTAAHSFVMTEPESAINISINGMSPACENNSLGAIDLKTAGGTAPYRYTWEGATNFGAMERATTEDLSNISAGMYAVTATDANNCTVSMEADLMEPIANAGSDIAINAGQKTTLQASGGETYLWYPSTGLSATNIANPVASPITTTTYMVTVKGAMGCEDFDNITISVTPHNLEMDDLSVTDPCGCDNPSNILLSDGRFLFQDILKVSTTSGVAVTLQATDNNLLNSSGTPIPVNATFTETPAGSGNYELPFYTLPNRASTVTISNSTSTIDFTTDSCSECADSIPTMSEWGLIIFGLLVLNMGVGLIYQHQAVIVTPK